MVVRAAVHHIFGRWLPRQGPHFGCEPTLTPTSNEPRFSAITPARSRHCLTRPARAAASRTSPAVNGLFETELMVPGKSLVDHFPRQDKQQQSPVVFAHADHLNGGLAVVGQPVIPSLPGRSVIIGPFLE